MTYCTLTLTCTKLWRRGKNYGKISWKFVNWQFFEVSFSYPGFFLQFFQGFSQVLLRFFRILEVLITYLKIEQWWNDFKKPRKSRKNSEKPLKNKWATNFQLLKSEKSCNRPLPQFNRRSEKYFFCLSS